MTYPELCIWLFLQLLLLQLFTTHSHEPNTLFCFRLYCTQYNGLCNITSLLIMIICHIILLYWNALYTRKVKSVIYETSFSISRWFILTVLCKRPCLYVNEWMKNTLYLQYWCYAANTHVCMPPKLDGCLI